MPFTKEELAERVELRGNFVIYHNPPSAAELHRRWAYFQQLLSVGTGYVRAFIEGTWIVAGSNDILSVGIQERIEVVELTYNLARVEFDYQLYILKFTAQLPQAVYFGQSFVNLGPMPRLGD